MAFDACLIFENPGSGGIAITGETMDEDMKKKKAFEIKQFSFGFTNTVNIGSQSGGAGAGKATFEDFSVQKNTDSGSPGLFRTCCSGGHYGDVTLILRRSGGDRSKSGTPFLTFKFKLVAVKSVNRSAERRVGKECVSTCRSRCPPYD